MESEDVALSTGAARQGSRLAWGLRHYAWVVVGCVLAMAAAPLVLGETPPVYQAQTLVVARQLTVNPEVLPSLAEAVFSDGSVAAAVAEDPSVAGGTGALIPDKVSVVTGPNSIAIAVQARDTDPAAAARLADLAAAAYVDELNRTGPGVAEFTIPSPAVVPTEPLSTVSAMTLTAGGAGAGLLLGTGLVALIAAVRRPILDAKDVEETAGVPLLGTVHLPSGARNGFPGPLGVRGMPAVTRWLATLPSGRLLLVSPTSGAEVRRRIYVMAAAALASLRPVRLEAHGHLIDAVHRHAVGRHGAGPATAEPGGLVLVDGGSPFDTVDPTTTGVSVVAVARRGISRGRLGRLTSDYVDGGLVGVVLVDVRPRYLQGGTHRVHGTAPPSREVDDVRSVGNVPEPERA
ncbi:Capsular polysaccharide biosynthesis protein [Geodermatophilus telluris]|uniref:Capsular polysaccharide biosynthesis protein n=1 Tax=Geodermatophilus telluris TaxID=1190417 RepID=A0A1G6L5G0_9ACTN|nr:Capsular polysaccharide biosynthesis protein [Geodermatophilus telluris]